MNKIVSHPVISATLRKLGVDPVQYGLLLDLFSKLSDRQEFEAGNARVSLGMMMGTFAAISGAINLVIAFGPKPPIHSYVFGNLVFATFLLLLILTMEAVNTFLNPVESSVLAHQPISDGSYFAAKLTYLGVVVGYVVFPISIVPALAGLNLKDASWLHPLTYLISVYLWGLFVALMGCGVLGLMFRILPPARVRNTVLWVQIGFFVFLGAGPRIMAALSGLTKTFDIANSNALPLNWFVVLASPTAAGLRALLTLRAALSMVACAVFIAFGIRALSKGYLNRVHTLLRSGASRRRSSRGVFGALARRITGRPSGRAAFAFVYVMARTDWQFRRTVYPMLIQLTILPLIGLLRIGFGHSPFEPGPPTFAYFIPHIGGVLGLIFSFAIAYSNQHRAAWIFLTVSQDSIRTFTRGIFCAFWLAMNILPLLLFPLFVWRWGIGDAALFGVYSLAIGSFYLSFELFLIHGMPFANPPEAIRGSMSAPLVILAVVGALILVGLQWIFIFQSRFVTAGATLAFAGAAYVVAQTSLRYLEVNVTHNLHVIATGRSAMFKEVG